MMLIITAVESLGRCQTHQIALIDWPNRGAASVVVAAAADGKLPLDKRVTKQGKTCSARVDVHESVASFKV